MSDDYRALDLKDSIQYKGVTLYRVVALRDIESKNGTILKDTKGGYIQKLTNLAGLAWVDEEAKVYGDAVVRNYARVKHNAEVFENASVYGHAVIGGDALVYGKAMVEGFVDDVAEVFGQAHVAGLVAGDAKVSAGKVPAGAEVLAGTIDRIGCCLVLDGMGYKVTITPGWMKIGCQLRNNESWNNHTSDHFLLHTDGLKGVEFWHMYKDTLKELCDKVNKIAGVVPAVC